MNDNHVIADSIVSLSAFAGLVFFILVLRSRDRGDPLYSRFRFGLSVVAIVMLARVFNWLFGSALAVFITVAAAGAVPLAALLITEGLLRRHAPFPLKAFAAGGAVLFFLVALLPSMLVGDLPYFLLLFFQLATFIAIGVLVTTRDKSSLSAAENKTIERIGLSLLIIVPTIITDFRFDGFNVPVRLAGIAILAMCWLGIGVGRPHISHRDTLTSFAVLVVAAGASGGALAVIADLGLAGTVQAIAITLSVLLVAMICNDSLSLRAEDRRTSLLKYLAQGDTGSSERFLSGLRDHLLIDGAVIVEDSELEDFDLGGLREIFHRHPVLSAADVRTMTHSSTDAREQLQSLLDRYEATYVMLTRETPLQLVVLNMPTLAVTTGTRIELQAVQRMASLIARGEPHA